jgi:hypothetical protein
MKLKHGLEIDSSTALPTSLIPDMRWRTEAALVGRFETLREFAPEGLNNSKFILVRNNDIWELLENEMGSVEIKTNNQWTEAGQRVQQKLFEYLNPPPGTSWVVPGEEAVVQGIDAVNGEILADVSGDELSSGVFEQHARFL